MTALLLLTLVSAILANNVIYQVTFPFFASIVLRETWAKGWFVPDDPVAQPKPSSSPEPPPTREAIGARRILRWAVGISAVIAFTYGPVEVKAAVIGLAAIWLHVWFWTAFDYR